MAKTGSIQTLDELLDTIESASDGNDDVSIDNILDEVGRRSFGPILMVAGLITVAPLIGDIPGVPTLFGIMVVLVAGQLLFRRDHFWLPAWMLNRSVSADKLEKGIDWMRKPVRFVDRLLKPRMGALVGKAGTYAIAAVCVVIGAAMPGMEIVPFSATGAGAALMAFGLALIAKDGLFALLAFVFTAGTLGIVAYVLW